MDPRDLIDDLLEVAVIPSFSRIGFAVRRRLRGWTPAITADLTGRTALVTGATGGLGQATVLALAARGARVVLVGRDGDRLDQLRASLGAVHGEDRFATIVADLSSIASVRSLVETTLASEERLDIVVDNAGAIHPERTTTADGIEASMALMAVGPFAMVAGLLPLLRRSNDARVIAVTSGGMYTQPLDVDDLDGAATAYGGPRFYARAKRAQVALIREWARRLAGSSITFASMHPGWARTPGLADSLPAFTRVLGPILRSAEEGVDTIIWLATAPRTAIEAGRVYLDRRPRPFDRIPATRLDAPARRRLWDRVVERAGVADPTAG